MQFDKRSACISVMTYQILVDDAEHVCVVHYDVRRVSGIEGEVSDGRIPGQPQVVQALFLQLPTPLGVLLLHQGVLKDLQGRKKKVKPITDFRQSKGFHILGGANG